MDNKAPNGSRRNMLIGLVVFLLLIAAVVVVVYKSINSDPTAPVVSQGSASVRDWIYLAALVPLYIHMFMSGKKKEPKDDSDSDSGGKN